MSQVAHLKGPEKEGRRESVFFETHADYVEGLDDFVTEQVGVKRGAFTVYEDSWEEDFSESSEFIYYADIIVAGLTANDYAEVNFDRTSQKITAEANLCLSGETMSGKIRIYAENIPTDSISGEYVITKGAV